MLNKIPPNNQEAEQSVLGAIFMSNDILPLVMEHLSVIDFYREGHRQIFTAIIELYEKGEVVDLVTLTEHLRKGEKLYGVGGISYITGLVNCVATTANISSHIKIVVEKSFLRKMINTAGQIALMGYEEADEIPVIIDRAEQMLFEIAPENLQTSFTSTRDLVKQTIDRFTNIVANKGQLTGVGTGFKDFDKLTNGLQQSDFVLIAARPSMGKTAFALNIAQDIAIKQKKSVVIFSLEMSKEQLMNRIVCTESNISFDKIKTANMGSSDWTNLMKAAEHVAVAPLFIDDTAGISVAEIRGKLRRMKTEGDIGLVIIDYIQLMEGSSTRDNGENRQQAISEISRGLKLIAREFNIPIIALSQLSRGVESRQNKRPILSDLRESGSLEQDADIVSFLYRDDYYNPDTENKNITELIIAKHRNGPIGTVNLFFAKDTTRFLNLEKSR